jgi:hypothetical protein
MRISEFPVSFKRRLNWRGGPTDPKNLHWIERILEAKYGTEKDERESGGGGGELEGEEVLDVVKDSLSFFNGAENGGKVVVCENHVGGLFGNVGT